MSERGDQMGTLAAADAAALLDDGTVAGRWVLDPAGSRAEFHVKHFWGAVTVHGSFSQITGGGSVGSDGTVTGRLSIEAASLGTGNKKRDEHLRSASARSRRGVPGVSGGVSGLIWGRALIGSW